MRDVVNHVVYEYKTNAKILWFTFLVLLVLMFPFTVAEGPQDTFLLVCFPMMVGWALGLAGKKDFCLKYYLSLPRGRKKILFLLLVGRSVSFFPTLIFFTVYYYAIPKHDYLNLNFPLFMLMLIITQAILNVTQLLSDIEAPRIENANSKFETFLMFIKKNIIYHFVYGSFLLYGGFLLVYLLERSPLSFLANQYAIILYLGLILYLSFAKCYKHLMEERRTYWNWKTDGVLSSVLGLGILAPALFLMATRESGGAQSRDILGRHPLHQVAKRCLPHKAKELLEQGAHFDAQDHLHRTALHYAVTHKCYATLALLLSYGPTMEIEDKFGKTPRDYTSDARTIFFLENRALFWRAPASK